MKRCEEFKELILTDYIDGELDKAVILSLEDHLLDCSECRSFFKEAKENVFLPLERASPQPVPKELWETIKQNIETQNQAGHPFDNFVEKLKGLFAFPRLVPILASLVVMVLAGSVTLNTIQVQQTEAKDQGEYLVSLLTPTTSSGPTDSSDVGTPIEHYFL